MCPPNRYAGYEFVAFFIGYVGFWIVYGRKLTAKARRACVDPDRYQNFGLPFGILFFVNRVGFPRDSDGAWFAFPVDEEIAPY
jgi:hypothetical protein